MAALPPGCDATLVAARYISALTDDLGAGKLIEKRPMRLGLTCLLSLTFSLRPQER
jgi:hypothetical protein